MSLRLPDDVRTAYLRHDGSVSGALPGSGGAMLLFVACSWWASLEEMTSEWRFVKKYCDETRVEIPEAFPSPEPFWNELKVKPMGGNDKWVPIGLSGTMSRIYLDLDPAPSGSVGQLMEESGTVEPTWLANSFDHYLEMLIERVARGALMFRDGWIWTETDEHVYDWNRIG